MSGAFLYLGKLIACALSGAEPPEPPEGVSLAAVWALAEKSGTERTAAKAFLAPTVFPLLDPATAKAVKSVSDSGTAQEVRREFQAQTVTLALAEAGIKVCPFKGEVVKRFYPSPDMRLMSDLDVLVSDAGACRSVMESLGYSRSGPSVSHHDKYGKPFEPLLVEIHKTPVGADNEAFGYYADVWEKLIPAGQTGVYALSPEDEYVFHIVHFYHHFSSGGCGVRPIVDLFGMRGSVTLDLSYTDRELSKLGLSEFGLLASDFASAFLNGGAWTEKLRSFGDVLESCGIYGSEERMIGTGMEKSGGSALSYLKSRVFRPLSAVRRESRAIDKCPPLIVGYWAGRFFGALFGKPAAVSRELRAVLRTKRKK